MKKFDFKKLALMGITGGVMCATQVNGVTTDSPKHQTTAQNTKLDEAHFLKKLSAENKATYMKLSQEGKALALKLANPDGAKPAEYSDPNDAVQIAQKRLEDQHQKPRMNTTPDKK